jgi:hypothetical protein
LHLRSLADVEERVDGGHVYEMWVSSQFHKYFMTHYSPPQALNTLLSWKNKNSQSSKDLFSFLLHHLLNDFWCPSCLTKLFCRLWLHS